MSEEQKQLVARAILDKYSSNTEVYFSSEILTAAGIISTNINGIGTIRIPTIVIDER